MRWVKGGRGCDGEESNQLLQYSYGCFSPVHVILQLQVSPKCAPIFLVCPATTSTREKTSHVKLVASILEKCKEAEEDPQGYV